MNGHKFITAERIFKNGVVSFGRNVWLAIAAMAMMTITLAVLLFAIVSNATFNHSVTNLTNGIDVSFYLKDSVTDSQRHQLITSLNKLPNVKNVTYISKDQALKNYLAETPSNANLKSAVSVIDNPLPASLTIKPVDPNKLQDIQTFLEKPAVRILASEPTSYSGDRKAAIDNITHATHFFQQAGVIGIIVFIVISILIIFNTIRMTIFNRRDELIIMRLLGASTAFIRGPFVVETMLYGAVAAAISLLLCGAVFKVASSTLQASSLGLLDIGYSNKFFTSHLFEILLLQLCVGILIGAASSLFATRRYLRFHR